MVEGVEVVVVGCLVVVVVIVVVVGFDVVLHCTFLQHFTFIS